MGAYFVRRGLRTAVALAVASVAIFYALPIASADPTGGLLSPTALEEVREAYHHEASSSK